MDPKAQDRKTRRQQLEAQRQRLQDLKKKNKQTTTSTTSSRTRSTRLATKNATKTDNAKPQLLEKKRKETDDFLKNLGIESESKPETNGHITNVVIAPTELPKPVEVKVQPRELPKLSTSSIKLVEFIPKEIISYARTTQTTTTENVIEESDDYKISQSEEQLEVIDQTEEKDKTPTNSRASTPVPKLKELTAEEQETIIKSEDFVDFLDKTTRVVERALTESIDIFTDYTGGRNDQDWMDPLTGEALNQTRVFYDDIWTSDRVISAIEWSNVYPELIYVAYGPKQVSNLNEPEGVICVWNIKFKKESPEYVFHCSSAITSLTLSAFTPNLVIGGTYSGQICVWDNKTRKRTPVQRSKHGAKSHTRPIFSLQVVGSANAHNLISISSDGRCCSWTLDMLAQPQEFLDLHHPFDKRRPISVNSSSFLQSNVNQFIIGCADGAVYQAQRHGDKPGITEMFGSTTTVNHLTSLHGGTSSYNTAPNIAHSGPVFSISSHQASGPLDFSHLFLTTSADWSMKLWSSKYSSNVNISKQKVPIDTAVNNSNIIPCIHTFENNQDYVYDIAWSPVHPAVFIAGDGQGNLDLWNINSFIEQPIGHQKLKGGSNTISKIAWSSKGDYIAVGDESGRLELFEVNEQLYNVPNEEWSKFMTNIQELLQSSDEEQRNENGSNLGLSSSKMYSNRHTTLSSHRYGGGGDFSRYKY